MNSSQRWAKYLDVSAVPVDEWPREVDEPCEIFVVHPNAEFAKDDEELKEWCGWFRASWTDFNGGGWVWNGLLGRVTHVRWAAEEQGQ